MFSYAVAASRRLFVWRSPHFPADYLEVSGTAHYQEYGQLIVLKQKVCSCLLFQGCLPSP